MAIKQLVVSDIGGEELEEGKAAKVTVSGHPALDNHGPVELDISPQEAGKLKDTDLYLVHLDITEPGSAPRRVTMEAEAFDKLFGNVDVGQLLINARSVSTEPSRGRRRRGTSTASSTTAKVDYSSPEHAGQLHRGRVTEEEAEWVRNNLEAANANRAKADQPAIDPSDAKEKKRYGF